jgi:hypothetical protein
MLNFIQNVYLTMNLKTSQKPCIPLERSWHWSWIGIGKYWARGCIGADCSRQFYEWNAFWLSQMVSWRWEGQQELPQSWCHCQLLLV